VTKVLYFASQTTGAWKTILRDSIPDHLESLMALSAKLPEPRKYSETFTVVASRSHISPETMEFVDHLKETHRNLQFVSVGSSLKLCLIAEGQADIYPRFGPTMEWDTAAGHAIVECSGGYVTLPNESAPVQYNKENLLNPWFIAGRNK
jgi:3'(2'), 5'-bisphosphate nucleotidase